MVIYRYSRTIDRFSAWVICIIFFVVNFRLFMVKVLAFLSVYGIIE